MDFNIVSPLFLLLWLANVYFGFPSGWKPLRTLLERPGDCADVGADNII